MKFTLCLVGFLCSRLALASSEMPIPPRVGSTISVASEIKLPNPAFPTKLTSPNSANIWCWAKADNSSKAIRLGTEDTLEVVGTQIEAFSFDPNRGPNYFMYQSNFEDGDLSFVLPNPDREEMRKFAHFYYTSIFGKNSLPGRSYRALNIVTSMADKTKIAFSCVRYSPGSELKVRMQYLPDSDQLKFLFLLKGE